MKFASLLTGSFFLATAGLGLAQNGSDRGRNRLMEAPVMRALDLDRDGILTESEWGKATESLLTLDEDGNGALSAKELGNFSERGANRRQRTSGREGSRGRGGPGPSDIGASPLDLGEPGIAWYGRLDLAKAEAKRTNRPILFMAAASQCAGVPGVF